MSYSKLIAGLAGPLMLALGVALLFNRDLFPAMASQIANDYAVIFLSGILALTAGVAIVRVHNTWTRDWTVIVTVLGWLLILSGLVRMWFPQMAAPVATSFAAQANISSCRASSSPASACFFPIKPMRDAGAHHE